MEIIRVEGRQQLLNLKKDIQSLFKRVFGEHLSDEAWRHYYLNTPYGTSTVFVSYSGRDIIAHGGLIPQKLISREGKEYDYYLQAAIMIEQEYRNLDIFHDGYGDGGNGRHICNHHLLKMWKRVFSARSGVLVVNEIARDFLLFSMKFSLGGDHIIRTKREGRDILGLIEKSSIYLKFTREEICQAESDLKKMGIQKGEPYVCMLNRDQKYLTETFPERDWHYHSFRDCSIKNYILAADELTKRGYYVIRMGAKVGELMETANPKIIEYEHKGFRTELLDIYLAAHCDFFIGCNSGFDAVPWLFHRPEVYVNVSDLEYAHTWLSNCVLIFKKYWLKREKRFMSVEEMIESGAGRFHRTAEYENMGIELIENTAEEILDVVDEMDMRLERRWQTTEEDEELQARFWSYFKSSDLHGVIRARIGTKFLRQHRELLGLFSKESIWA